MSSASNISTQPNLIRKVSLDLRPEDQAALRAAALVDESLSDTIRRCLRLCVRPRTVAVDIRRPGVLEWSRQFVLDPAEAESRARAYRARGLDVRLTDVAHVPPPSDLELVSCEEQARRLNAARDAGGGARHLKAALAEAMDGHTVDPAEFMRAAKS